MMQPNFKKDSRVWLHKNARRKSTGNEKANKCSPEFQKRVTMNALEEEGLDNTIPYIRGDDGRVYKKDSRTWLHKSSIRTQDHHSDETNTLRTKSTANNPRRTWGIVQKMKEIATKKRLSVGTAPPDKSPETILGAITAGKRKKNSPRGRTGLSSVSHRDFHVTDEWEETAFGACNHCHDKRPRFRYIKGSYSDQDNTNDESSGSDSDVSNSSHGSGLLDEEENDKNHHHQQHMQYRRLCECSETHHAPHSALNCNDDGCDALPLCRSNASIELTQDGLNAVREIAREMQLQPIRRSSFLLENPDNSLIPDEPPMIPIDLSSSGPNSSKTSLNFFGINLSDECVTALEEVPGAESDYQLSQATQGLNVQSPTNVQKSLPSTGDHEDKKIVVD